MARKPRIEFEGAFCHVIIRGNHPQGGGGETDERKRYQALKVEIAIGPRVSGLHI